MNLVQEGGMGEPRLHHKVGLFLVVSVVITEICSNLCVIPVIFPFSPSKNLNLCNISDLMTIDCNYWNGKWYQLGSRSTYTLSANNSEITCIKDTGCQNYRFKVPKSNECFLINDGTCWELCEIYNNQKKINRTYAYVLNSLIFSPIIGIIPVVLFISIKCLIDKKHTKNIELNIRIDKHISTPAPIQASASIH